jgi:hypothetical protein
VDICKQYKNKIGNPSFPRQFDNILFSQIVAEVIKIKRIKINVSPICALLSRVDNSDYLRETLANVLISSGEGITHLSPYQGDFLLSLNTGFHPQSSYLRVNPPIDITCLAKNCLVRVHKGS